MSPYPGAFAVVLVLIVLVAVIGTARQHFRARRNEKQIDAERAMRRGAKAMPRYGLKPEDLQ